MPTEMMLKFASQLISRGRLSIGSINFRMMRDGRCVIHGMCRKTEWFADAYDALASRMKLAA